MIMNHLDEGTIHAWLDGELPADQARAVEEHVRDCRTCADAVAEARGLVAASSRILGALDDVPAKVIPQLPVRKTRPMWRAAPWVTGIAAVLVAAVVLRTGNDSTAMMSDPMEARVADFADTQAAGVAVQPPPPAAPTASAPRVEVARAPSVGPQRQKAAQPTVRAGAGSDLRGAVGSVAAAAPPEQITVTSAPVPADARARRAVSADVAGERAREASRFEQLQEQRGRAASSARSSAAALAPQRSAADMSAAELPAAQPVAPELAALGGCYAVDAGGQRGLLVRLDTLRGEPGYLVRLARSDSSLGWWQRIAPDTAQLNLLSAGTVTVTAGQRVNCP